MIGPILALMLADSKSLVTQVVPNALLDMSRNVMWKQYCQVIVKPVYTLTFSRSWPTLPKTYEKMYQKMIQARKSGGIVVTTPSAIKSIVNKYIELLNVVATVDRLDLLVAPKEKEYSYRQKEKSSAAALRKKKRQKEIQLASETADAIATVMNLWSEREKGVLLLDEVDMLLHPLRSELNFPIGEKFPLNPSPSRWDLPTHLLDTLLHASYIAMDESKTPERNIKELVDALRAGIHEKSLQTTPHLVLLDPDFYRLKLKIIIATKSLTWMKAHHVFEGLDAPNSNEMKEYVEKGNGCSQSVSRSVNKLRGQSNTKNANAGASAIQVLNLAHDWVTSFVPHAMSKVDRVNFGLLQPQDERVLGGDQPASRRLLGIPFVGKDVPSQAAEFAQPDVLIGATIMAYRYEGLRQSDLRTIVRMLKESMQQESGPKKLRPAYAKFETWIANACQKYQRRRRVMDLELFQLADVTQTAELYKLIHMESEVIHYYLRNIVFPKTMQQQRVKISSSGQELGSDILFGRRLGFSGTPSNLLPVDIVPCRFEKGSEGKILRCLTDSNVTKEAQISIDVGTAGKWSVQGVLDQIAQATDPPFHALIDTGALITGYSNEEVARYLTDTGLKHLQGCVFLDHLDRKMIYLRGAARCIPLSECGLARGKRFTFYDQVHTTGMDIKQQISACACLTIGKDMTFRDYAQGAFRMRGIGKGQTIHLYLVPEIKRLIQKTLPHLTGNVEDDVAAWLQLNNMKMEKLQFLQLCSQSMQTVWRKVALNNLLGSSGIRNIPNVDPSMPIGLTRFYTITDSVIPYLGITKKDSDETKNRKDILKESIRALKDIVDFDIPTTIPASIPYAETLQAMVNENRLLVKSQEQKKTVKIVMKQIDDVLKSGDTGTSGKKGLNSEMTREKEREQEQQKQKQQQQQVESMYARDNSQPYQWPVSILDSAPLGYDASIRESSNGTKWESEFPFYPLSIFSPRPKEFKFGKVKFSKIKPLEFPHDMLQSTNFAPIGRDTTKPLKLKNVNVVLDWIVSASERRTIILTLSEAETLRRIIQTKRKYHQPDQGNDSQKFALVVLPQCVVLECTKTYDQTKDIDQLIMTSTKFWNNEMFYKDHETEMLLKALQNNNKDNRKDFFEASLAAYVLFVVYVVYGYVLLLFG